MDTFILFKYNGNAGEPFFFKLKAKYNHAICGFGYFAKYAKLPLWLAWDSFHEKNGCDTIEEMQNKIAIIRKSIAFKSSDLINNIGCILISQPIFFRQEEWISGPKDWSNANPRYTFYDLNVGEGIRIYNECLQKVSLREAMEGRTSKIIDEQPLYGKIQLVKPRIGQGTFRISVMEAYQNSCAITTEHSLPVLEAAHIMPFSKQGPNEITNGLLLRADLHKLFDTGYITVTTDHKMEVSGRLKDDFNNGKIYYKTHGNRINLPKNLKDIPLNKYIEYHNTQVFIG